MPKDYTTQGCKDLGFKDNGAVMHIGTVEGDYLNIMKTTFDFISSFN